ncbi:MAG: YitT family protein [Bacteroidales bacterium]|jgi:uncharacterized membrane-anchored protein YitT (DUF2179 family)|nr:YitT family protein [Bacteroidales bacterium]
MGNLLKSGSGHFWIGLKEYFFITLGLLSYVLGWVIFLIPNNLVGGGVTGISAILLYAFDIPVSISFFIMNLILLLISLKVLGGSFGIKTVYAIIIASVFFDLVPRFVPQTFINEIAISNGKLLCSIFGGAVAGFGIGMCFSQGGSTGGTDIIALMVSKYRNISPGKVILLIDIFVIASSLLLPAKEITDAAGNIIGMESFGERFARLLYGYLLIGTTSYTIDLYISGTKQSLQVFIFSKKYSGIADYITGVMGRGVTVLDSQGWYTKNPGKVLLVLVRKTDLNSIYKVVKSVDKDAFMSVGNVMGVYGKGFDKIKQ